MTLESEMREVLEKTIEVYYTKDQETNKKREADKRWTINWIIKGVLEGPIKGGMQGSYNCYPDPIWTFGESGIWEAEKKCIIMRDPMCKICGKNPSTEVHHIRPKHLKGLAVHPQNLIGLCRECHDEVHRRIDAGICRVCEESLDFDIAPVKGKRLEDLPNFTK